MTPGYIAALTFFLSTVLGLIAQVYKLNQRTTRWRCGELGEADIYAGLLPSREFWSFTAFLLFALSGLTRSYTDYIIIGSRLPALILATLILYSLARHHAPGALRLYRLALCGNFVFASLGVAHVLGIRLDVVAVARTVDYLLGAVSICLLVGKMTQAVTMFRRRRSGGVSLLREAGLVVKDSTGIWYATTIGAELFVVGMTHALSISGSVAIVVVKCLLEYRPLNQEETH